MIYILSGSYGRRLLRNGHDSSCIRALLEGNSALRHESFDAGESLSIGTTRRTLSVASNAVALMKASLRAVHKPAEVAEMSSHYLASEVRQTYRGMRVALPPPDWEVFRNLEAVELAEVLRTVAAHVRPARYRKARRGPKKPRPPHAKYKNGGHVSTQRILDARKK